MDTVNRIKRVEEIILRHPKVHDVAVIGIPDQRLGEISAAVIETRQDQALTEQEVTTFCEENLPRFKRPRRILFDHVPRNPTGKIEKPKLREKLVILAEAGIQIPDKPSGLSGMTW